MRYISIFFLSIAIVLGVYVSGVYLNLYGELEEPGLSVNSEIPRELVQSKLIAQQPFKKNKQILFGDTHVHTTYSTDAFFWSLPIMNGEGPHPISDACDFARFCANLDFWVSTDHAEALTPRKWKSIKEAVRNCNAPTNPVEPDLVTFLGYEWTQVGDTRENHYGHKNVMFLDIEENKVPKRPIGAGGIATNGMRNTLPGQAEMLRPAAFLDFENRHRYFNFISFAQELQRGEFCEEGVSSDLLDENCYESAETPQDLFKKLNELNFPTIVIPHGNTWGFYSPPGITLDKQLESDFNDENLQILFEVMSGHGNSEEYRPWRAVNFDQQNNAICPKPSRNYLPSCWRAGQIIYERCIEDDLDKELCLLRAEEARENYAVMGVAGHLTVPGVEIEEWLDSGQCRDCFIPSFNYRPGGSAQYGLAITNFDNGDVKRFNFGFIASSDNHRARPGTGYKEIDRFVTTEANGPSSDYVAETLYPKETSLPQSIDLRERNLLGLRAGFGSFEAEREASFFSTGGLAAIHSYGRDRNSIWDSLRRKETYGTSGDRILLWFDLISENSLIPMGGSIRTNTNPVFKVKAVGAFKQKPGCPDYSSTNINEEEIARICKNECYNPSDVRKAITRIEVIKITPQAFKGENVENLILDPWRVFECKPNQEGCEIKFTDDQYNQSSRDASYYVRAIQEASPAINAGNLRCTFDESGNCSEVNICYGDNRTSREDDCLVMSEERAWSSPIYLNYLDL
tara:strand:+ start:8514 stop:10736 length:2223 start_codon:yes stop_codon:yes gene_type:complete